MFLFLPILSITLRWGKSISKRSLPSLAAFVSVAGGWHAGHAQIVLLDSGYDLIALGSASLRWSTFPGRIAATGSVDISLLSGVGRASDNRLPIVYAGSDLSVSLSSISNGDAVYGGRASVSLSLFSSGHGAYEVSSAHQAPFSSNEVRQHFVGLSSGLGGLNSTGTVSYRGRNLTFSGTESFNVFTVNLSDYKNIKGFAIDAPRGSTVVVNILGSDINMISGSLNGGVQASNVLFNFVDATSISLGGVTTSGSFLAPFASISGSGTIDGQIIGQNFDVIWFETTGSHFTGNLPAGVAIPEPETYAALLCGAALLFAGRRRFRRVRRV